MFKLNIRENKQNDYERQIWKGGKGQGQNETNSHRILHRLTCIHLRNCQTSLHKISYKEKCKNEEIPGIDIYEIEPAIKEINNNKAADKDAILAEMLKES